MNRGTTQFHRDCYKPLCKDPYEPPSSKMECHFFGIHDRGVQNLKYAVEESSIAIGSEEEAHAKFGGVMEMYHDTMIYTLPFLNRSLEGTYII